MRRSTRPGRFLLFLPLVIIGVFFLGGVVFVFFYNRCGGDAFME
jgi:hypothetical protein